MAKTQVITYTNFFKKFSEGAAPKCTEFMKYLLYAQPSVRMGSKNKSPGAGKNITHTYIYAQTTAEEQPAFGFGDLLPRSVVFAMKEGTILK